MSAMRSANEEQGRRLDQRTSGRVLRLHQPDRNGVGREVEEVMIQPLEDSTIVTVDDRDKMWKKINELVEEVNALRYVLERIAPGHVIAATLRKK